jgi:carbon-monoxide dehydrogenase medium subunit
MIDLEILEPSSLAEAAALLRQHGDDAKAIAGGTALVLLLRNRLLAPRYLISIGQLSGFDQIVVVDSTLRIGALATIRAVERSALVRKQLPILAEAMGKVANVRVRNAATVGGNVAEADYASDPPCVLVALDASARLVGASGERSLPIRDLIRGFYETALESGEVVSEVVVPIPAPGTAGTYLKFTSRSSEDRPCVGVAAFVRPTPDGRSCADLRVAIGAVAGTPQRFPEVENDARGQPLGSELARAVAEGYASRVEPIGDLRGSAWYRTQMIRVLVRRALESAMADAARKTSL